MARNGKEGGLGMHRNIPYEFAITMSYLYVVDTFFAPLVESMRYAALECAKERVRISSPTRSHRHDGLFAALTSLYP